MEKEERSKKKAKWGVFEIINKEDVGV